MVLKKCAVFKSNIKASNISGVNWRQYDVLIVTFKHILYTTQHINFMLLLHSEQIFHVVSFPKPLWLRYSFM